MSVNFEIEAVSRSDGGKGASRRLRKTGMVPGVVYGAGKDPEMISVQHNELIHQLENEAFYSHILTLNVAGNKQKVVLKDLQRHPAKPFVMHLDLQRVSEEDKIKMHVPLHFLNESKAVGVKAGGKLSHAISDVEVICLPKDLPEFIEVDVMEMQVGDVIHLSDINLPQGVELPQLALGEDHDLPVVTIQAARGGSSEDEEGGEEA
jgi:large subunit ribosomal protein L25